MKEYRIKKEYQNMMLTIKLPKVGAVAFNTNNEYTQYEMQNWFNAGAYIFEEVPTPANEQRDEQTDEQKIKEANNYVNGKTSHSALEEKIELSASKYKKPNPTTTEEKIDLSLKKKQ